jgi:hypothetical protein
MLIQIRTKIILDSRIPSGSATLPVSVPIHDGEVERVPHPGGFEPARAMLPQRGRYASRLAADNHSRPSQNMRQIICTKNIS